MSVLLSGPASIQMIDGEANILGSKMQKSNRVIIAKERQLPIDIKEFSHFELSLGQDACYKIIKGSTIPESWKSVIKEIERHDLKKIIVIGGVDVGKNTFCTFLANSFLKFGIQIFVIDADIGQSDLGPPTTIGLGQVTNHILNLSSTKIVNLFFIGDIKPDRVTNKVIFGIKKLLNYVSASSPSVINTDGWIKGMDALSFKKKLVKEISPDLILNMSNKRDLNHIYKNFDGHHLYLNPSKLVKKRSREERRKLREYGYRKYLKNASIKYISLDSTKVESEKSLEENKLIGLIDRKGMLIEIGILKDFDKIKRVMKIYTPIEKINKLHKIEIGSVKVSEFGKELKSLEAHA